MHLSTITFLSVNLSFENPIKSPDCRTWTCSSATDHSHSNFDCQVMIMINYCSWHIWRQLNSCLTWCNAVKPSIFAVSMSAPLLINFSTSSLSEAAQAARKTHPSVNWILGSFLLGSVGSWLVLDSPQRFNCSALLKRAEEFRFSKEFICEYTLE